MTRRDMIFLLSKLNNYENSLQIAFEANAYLASSICEPTVSKCHWRGVALYMNLG